MAQPDVELPADPASVVIAGRIVEAVGHMNKAKDWLSKARQDRDRAIADARVHGWSTRQVATFTGLSIAQIANIDREQGVQSTRVATRRP